MGCDWLGREICVGVGRKGVWSCGGLLGVSLCVGVAKERSSGDGEMIGWLAWAIHH